mmetsp:Transcript_14027/g.23419  ORF Transcript_14027/g.23419 Transcript_14027/m.23419 type:complete len:226 (-) Transcript_14027:318-995(-)
MGMVVPPPPPPLLQPSFPEVQFGPVLLVQFEWHQTQARAPGTPSQGGFFPTSSPSPVLCHHLFPLLFSVLSIPSLCDLLFLQISFRISQSNFTSLSACGTVCLPVVLISASIINPSLAALTKNSLLLGDISSSVGRICAFTFLSRSEMVSEDSVTAFVFCMKSSIPTPNTSDISSLTDIQIRQATESVSGALAASARCERPMYFMPSTDDFSLSYVLCNESLGSS